MNGDENYLSLMTWSFFCTCTITPSILFSPPIHMHSKPFFF